MKRFFRILDELWKMKALFFLWKERFKKDSHFYFPQVLNIFFSQRTSFICRMFDKIFKIVSTRYPHDFFSRVFCGKSQGKLKNPCGNQPVISLIRSSTSILKTESRLIFFSMIAQEEIMVEWSRLKIFPILGRDISVMVRIR